jgi:hypothetical protein
MEISNPNENGVFPERSQEVVAPLGRSYAAINFAFCDDGLFRFSTELHYSYGGFVSPIYATCPGYATLDAARMAGLEELLRRWQRAFPSEPASVHDELNRLQEQIAAELQQPTLF